MEKQVDAGRAKAIGLSNFKVSQIQRVLDNSRIKPANLQIELHLYMQQKPLVEFCTKNNISVTAFSSLGSPGAGTFFNEAGLKVELPSILKDPVAVELAKKYGKSTAQIVLRHIVQKGIITIPKSTNPERIKQNIQIFDFELSPEDMAKLNKQDKGKAGRIFDLDNLFDGSRHPEYPFDEY